MDLNGKAALVTGGAGGIGAAIARALAGAGADVAVSYASEAPRADEMVEALRKTGRRSYAVQLDQRDTKSIDACVKAVTGHFGRPGTNALHSWLMPLWSDSKGERSEITGFEYIGGLLPLNTLSEEFLADHPNRARVLTSKPLNTSLRPVVRPSVVETSLSRSTRLSADVVEKFRS